MMGSNGEHPTVKHIGVGASRVIEPAPKPSGLNQLASLLLGKDREQTIKDRKCVFCDLNACCFKDEEGIKEYSITGLCQACQDEVFG